jgi:hypothetical protein
LHEGNTIIFEQHASVAIEGENNESFPLSEQDSGTYVSQQLFLNANEKYRLHIKTSNGKEYLSDYSSYRTTPPIDSLTWKRVNGVDIYVSSHDSTITTGYYKWEYVETWEYHSSYESNTRYDVFDEYGFGIHVSWRFPSTHIDSTLYRCWKTVNSTNIIIGSTEKLTSNVIYLPVQNIPEGSEALSVLYSIYVKQFAISKENYEFLQKMKKNTEQLGSIFDAQPSELKGNIHCASDTNEIVVGYIDVSQEQDKRIFISNAEVPDWNYTTDCFEIEVGNDPESIKKNAIGLAPAMAKTSDPLGNVSSFYAAPIQCVDCSYDGRSNIKPDFWP